MVGGPSWPMMMMIPMSYPAVNIDVVSPQSPAPMQADSIQLYHQATAFPLRASTRPPGRGPGQPQAVAAGG